MKAATRGPKIVVIGGGTGTYTLLSGLKFHTRDITAIVNMSDDGGSTGILRDELDVLPPGDIRQCLVALSESSQTLRDLFGYRFEDGTLRGHSFGNLFLAALEKTTGSFDKAVKAAGEILEISGRIVPVTLTNSRLVLTHPDGHTTIGQYNIQDSRFAHEGPPSLSLKPKSRLNPEAKQAIAEADLIVIAPGGLYYSLAPALIVENIGQALRDSPAKIVYISNLINRPGHTDGFKVHDYVREIERFIGGPAINYVIYNRQLPSTSLLEKYARVGEYPVEFDERLLAKAPYEAIGDDLVSDTIPKLSAADQNIPRTFIRHDSDKIARLIMQICFT